jgi:hypothetical protein
LHAKLVADGGKDIMKIEVDWKDVVRNVFNTSEKTLNAFISIKNKKVMLWKMLDFSNKINVLLKNDEKKDSKLSESQITQDQQ